MSSQAQTSISRWYKTFTDANIAVPLWYAILSGCALVTWMVFHGLFWLVRFIWKHTSFFTLRYLVYPHLFRRLPFINVATRSEILLGVLYITFNTLCVIMGRQGVVSRDAVSARAATMSVINIIPLLCGPRLLLMMKLLGISLRTHFGVHKWIGGIVVAEALLHTVLSVIHDKPFQWTATNYSGVVGIASFGFLILQSFHFIQRLFYKWFLRSHFLLAVSAIVALWLHLSSKKHVGKVFLQIGISLWTAVTGSHVIYFIFRNWVLGRSLAVAQVTECSGALQVKVTVPRPWNVKAGQYIFLSIPAARLTSALQSHPFMIVWWESDVDGLTISLLIKPRRGFTRRLGSFTNRNLTAFIDGPYGSDHNLGEYGTVLMFATGIGIAGHISYIRELVRGYNSCEVRTRRILLVWQAEDEGQQNWVKHWMDKVIKMDTGFILEISLHVHKISMPGQYDMEPSAGELKRLEHLASGKVIPHSDHDKLNQSFGPANVGEIVKTECDARKGRLIISVCSNDTMADQVRRAVKRNMHPGVRLVELDFEPSLRHTRHTSRRHASTVDMDFGCRGIN